jgi:hypothetical protein
MPAVPPKPPSPPELAHPQAADAMAANANHGTSAKPRQQREVPLIPFPPFRRANKSFFRAPNGEARLPEHPRLATRDSYDSPPTRSSGSPCKTGHLGQLERPVLNQRDDRAYWFEIDAPSVVMLDTGIATGQLLGCGRLGGPTAERILEGALRPAAVSLASWKTHTICSRGRDGERHALSVIECGR